MLGMMTTATTTATTRNMIRDHHRLRQLTSHETTVANVLQTVLQLHVRDGTVSWFNSNANNIRFLEDTTTTSTTIQKDDDPLPRIQQQQPPPTTIQEPKRRPKRRPKQPRQRRRGKEQQQQDPKQQQQQHTVSEGRNTMSTAQTSSSSSSIPIPQTKHDNDIVAPNTSKKWNPPSSSYQRILLQVQHPLRTIESWIHIFCEITTTTTLQGEGQSRRQQTDSDLLQEKIVNGTLHPSFVLIANTMFGRRPINDNNDNNNNNNNEDEEDDNNNNNNDEMYFPRAHNFSNYTCLQGTSYYWLEYMKAMERAIQQGWIHSWYRMESTSPCQIAEYAGLLQFDEDHDDDMALYYRPHVERLQQFCHRRRRHHHHRHRHNNQEQQEDEDSNHPSIQHQPIPTVITALQHGRRNYLGYLWDTFLQMTTMTTPSSNYNHVDDDDDYLDNNATLLDKQLSWEDYLQGRLHCSIFPQKSNHETRLMQELQYWTFSKLNYPDDHPSILYLTQQLIRKEAKKTVLLSLSVMLSIGGRHHMVYLATYAVGLGQSLIWSIKFAIRLGFRNVLRLYRFSMRLRQLFYVVLRLGNRFRNWIKKLRIWNQVRNLVTPLRLGRVWKVLKLGHRLKKRAVQLRHVGGHVKRGTGRLVRKLTQRAQRESRILLLSPDDVWTEMLSCQMLAR